MSPDTAAYGLRDVRIPHLDRLATDSRRYTRAVLELYDLLRDSAGVRWFHPSQGGLFGQNDGYDSIHFRVGRRWKY